MAHENGNGSGFLTARELADRLHVHVDTIRLWTRKRELPYITLPGGRYRYDPAEIEQWVEAHHGSMEDA